MTAGTWHEPLWAFTAVSLEELTERAALQTRVDRKYLLPEGAVGTLLARIGPRATVLQIAGARAFGYESVYFDTPDLVSYLLAARRRRRRFKVRTRTYLDSHECWLEVKTRGTRGSTVKHRLPYRPDDHEAIEPGRGFVELVLADGFAPSGAVTALRPTLVTRYRRSTLLLSGPDSRVTVDTDLEWVHTRGRLRLPGLAIVETKTGSAASVVDRLLWNSGYRPLRVSKYATGLAALRPDLPATRWRRTLRRYFPAATTDGLAAAPAA